MGAPIKKINRRGIDVAVWPTKTGGVSATIQKRYKDKLTQEYKTTTVYFVEDLETLRDILSEAIMFMRHGEPTTKGMQSVQDVLNTAMSHMSAPAIDIDNDDIPF